MDATMTLDRVLLRAIRQRPVHGYDLVRSMVGDETPDRATIYRRLAALEARGLIVSSEERVGGRPARKVFRVTPAGELALHGEAQEAFRRLLEAFAEAQRKAGRADGPEIEAPVAFLSVRSPTTSERRVLARLGSAFPRRVHLVLPRNVEPDIELPEGVAWASGTAADLPFPAGHIRLLMGNGLPAPEQLVPAVKEWVRVLHPQGSLNMVAPAPLPVGADPFVDFLADLQSELFPEAGSSPQAERVHAALSAAFEEVSALREGNQIVWHASRKRLLTPDEAGRTVARN